jgi:hypothetical protein
LEALPPFLLLLILLRAPFTPKRASVVEARVEWKIKIVLLLRLLRIRIPTRSGIAVTLSRWLLLLHLGLIFSAKSKVIFFFLLQLLLFDPRLLLFDVRRFALANTLPPSVGSTF